MRRQVKLKHNFETDNFAAFLSSLQTLWQTLFDETLRFMIKITITIGANEQRSTLTNHYCGPFPNKFLPFQEALSALSDAYYLL